jgi:hypothetical protein
MGFYVTESSFRTRPPLSPHLHRLPRHSGLPPAHRHTDTTHTPRSTGSYDETFSVPGRSPTPDGPTACLTPTHQTKQRISRHSPSPLRTTHRLAERRPSVSPPSWALEHPPTQLPSVPWSSRHIPRSFGLAAPRTHPETIGLLSRGVRSPAVCAPRNAS